MKLTLTILAFFLLCLEAHAATFYVATNGSNSADGTTNTPWLTIRHGLATMNGGDTLHLRGGLYDYETGAIEEFKSGPAIGQNTVLQSYPNELATIRSRSTNSSGNPIYWGMIVDNAKSNILINGLLIDAANCSVGDGIKLTGGSINLTVTNTAVFGCPMGMGILTTGVSEGDWMNGLITHCRFITNGWFQAADPESHSDLHQIYIQTSGMTVENSYFQGGTNSRGVTSGINYFGGDSTNAIFRNNFFTNCSIGILASASRGSNLWMYNNSFQNCDGAILVNQMYFVHALNNTCWSNDIAIQISNSTNVWVENNIAVNSLNRGIYLQSNIDQAFVRNNLGYSNSWLNLATSYGDLQVNTSLNVIGVTTNGNLFNVVDLDGTKTTNTTVYSAQFVSPAASNFRVLSTSDAIGRGKTQSLFTTDAGGVSRIGPWTIGAWQFNIPLTTIGTAIIYNGRQ